LLKTGSRIIHTGGSQISGLRPLKQVDDDEISSKKSKKFPKKSASKIFDIHIPFPIVFSMDESKSEVKPEVKPEIKSGAKPEVKPETKPEIKSVPK